MLAPKQFSLSLRRTLKRVSPKELGVEVRGIREFLVEVGVASEDRSTIKNLVGQSGLVHHLVFEVDLSADTKVSLTKKLYRGTRRACINIEKKRALKLLCAVLTGAKAVESVASRDNLLRITPANRSASFGLQERVEPRLNIFRGL